MKLTQNLFQKTLLLGFYVSLTAAGATPPLPSTLSAACLQYLALQEFKTIPLEAQIEIIFDGISETETFAVADKWQLDGGLVKNFRERMVRRIRVLSNRDQEIPGLKESNEFEALATVFATSVRQVLERSPLQNGQLLDSILWNRIFTNSRKSLSVLGSEFGMGPDRARQHQLRITRLAKDYVLASAAELLKKQSIDDKIARYSSDNILQIFLKDDGRGSNSLGRSHRFFVARELYPGVADWLSQHFLEAFSDFHEVFTPESYFKNHRFHGLVLAVQMGVQDAALFHPELRTTAGQIILKQRIFASAHRLSRMEAASGARMQVENFANLELKIENWILEGARKRLTEIEESSR